MRSLIYIMLVALFVAAGCETTASKSTVKSADEDGNASEVITLRGTTDLDDKLIEAAKERAEREDATKGLTPEELKELEECHKKLDEYIKALPEREVS